MDSGRRTAGISCRRFILGACVFVRARAALDAAPRRLGDVSLGPFFSDKIRCLSIYGTRSRPDILGSAKSARLVFD